MNSNKNNNKKNNKKKKSNKLSAEQKNRIRIYKKLKDNPKLQEEILKKQTDLVHSWLEFIMYDFIPIITPQYFRNFPVTIWL